MHIVCEVSERWVWFHVWEKIIMGSLNVSTVPAVSVSCEQCLYICSSSRQPPCCSSTHTVPPRFTTRTLNISTVWLQQTACLVQLEKDSSAGTVTRKLWLSPAAPVQIPFEKWDILERFNGKWSCVPLKLSWIFCENFSYQAENKYVSKLNNTAG